MENLPFKKFYEIGSATKKAVGYQADQSGRFSAGSSLGASLALPAAPKYVRGPAGILSLPSIPRALRWLHKFAGEFEWHVHHDIVTTRHFGNSPAR